MANDALSAIVPIVAVYQLPINIVVVGKGTFSCFLPPPVRNSHSATARLFLLVLYSIGYMFTLK